MDMSCLERALQTTSGSPASSEDSSFCTKHELWFERTPVELFGRTRMIGECPRCEEAAAAQEQEQELERKRRRLPALQHEAGIPPRYRRATLSPFPSQARGQGDVLEAAKRFVDTAGKGSGGLILLGQVGAGKTHVALAILNAFLKEGMSGRYYTLSSLLRTIRESWKRTVPVTELEILQKLWTVGLLVIDEIGVTKVQDAEYASLTDIVSGRYDRRLPTILISNLNLERFTAEVGDRVVDRLRQGGKVLLFGWQSFRPTIEDPA
jgi:DNA replication protein DnaC